ncbi:prolyl oligopeptidase family serine peptidase [Vagococcus elongatus]|uniref:Peptidase S9 prolyl oligopeptidase catalytic domain-containing protein n=1 Tax=Vagococcus elongatus TaxID=180344 RepID=A0A430B5F6_9ENTE|nr:prolyl oligopeptidase family serine peptidase [Vagococcus elongatus]RSU15529.1 hypothetical protein CBF29_00175 [Vagococcus elongatus]
MIEVHRKTIAGIPVLEVIKENYREEMRPLVFFYHGWTGTKEAVLVNGYELAKRGMRAVLPEAIFHGERKDHLETEEHFMEFWNIVLKNIAEFPSIVDAYVEMGLASKEQVGVTGLSMGGITTCGVMASYPWVKAGDCLMGTPCFVDFTQKMLAGVDEATCSSAEVEETIAQLEVLDLSLHPEKLMGRPLHFWHGTEDDTVPYQPTFDFYLKNKSEDFGQSLTFTTTDDGHKVPYKITIEMAEFFKKQF